MFSSPAWKQSFGCESLTTLCNAWHHPSKPTWNQQTVIQLTELEQTFPALTTYLTPETLKLGWWEPH